MGCGLGNLGDCYVEARDTAVGVTAATTGFGVGALGGGALGLQAVGQGSTQLTQQAFTADAVIGSVAYWGLPAVAKTAAQGVATAATVSALTRGPNASPSPVSITPSNGAGAGSVGKSPVIVGQSSGDLFSQPSKNPLTLGFVLIGLVFFGKKYGLF